jgi:predicted AAA+ superfamily ATPase
MEPAAYTTRLVDLALEELFGELPAMMVTGPRATGKTTTAARHVASVAHIDRPQVSATFQADPDVALAGYEEPVLLDEWQEVPSVLGAVKRAVDRDPRPGRFLLTGSVRADFKGASWPGTGRVVRIPMYGMTVRELRGDVKAPSPLDRLEEGRPPDPPSERPDLREYVELALRSGFPDPALTMHANARRRWLEGYVDQLLTRDLVALDERRDPARLRLFLEAYALNTAGAVSDATLIRAAGINRRTGVAYEQLLSNLFIVEGMPAWASNRLRRLSRGAKRYLVDPAIAAATLGLDAQAVLRDGDLLGRLLDTFVVAQLRAEGAVSTTRPRLYHLREEHGRREIDVLAEIGGGDVIAFEVKATGTPDLADARHLLWLRDRLGDRFRGGVVFHTGLVSIELEERVVALPICARWG